MSSAFASRLKRLKPEQKVRAVLLLQKPKNGSPALGHRQTPADRKALVEATRRSSEAALTEVDRILTKYGGKRLSPEIDALGSIPIETTTSGLLALADAKQVHAILEDQEIAILDGRRK